MCGDRVDVGDVNIYEPHGRGAVHRGGRPELLGNLRLPLAWWAERQPGIMDRMNPLGLYDSLRMFKGHLTPTFRSPRGGSVIHQLDHLYVTPSLLSRLSWCD